MGRAQTKAAVWLALLLASIACAFALDPALDVSQYAHTSWKIRDGFTRGTIFAIAQTPDGYLWLGTEFGLVRFDGVQATHWRPAEGQQLPDNFVHALLVSRDGTLWIGTEKGLASWKDGKLTQYPEVAGHDVHSVQQDAEGTVWVGVRRPGRLCAIRSARTQCYGDGTFGWSVSALYEDHKGNLWVSAPSGLWRWAPGTPEHYTFPGGAVLAHALGEDDKGRLLMATSKSNPYFGPVNGALEGLKQFVDGRIQDYRLPFIANQFRPIHMARSSDGSLWLGTVHGLLHVYQGKIDRFSVNDGLSGDIVTDIFEDREGDVWVATETGLDRFREFAVPTISVNQGLSSSAVDVIEGTPDGSIWIATADGLNHWQNGHVTVYGKRSEPGQDSRTYDRDPILSARVTEIADSGFGRAVSLGHDDRGQLWVGSQEGVFYFHQGRFARVPRLPGGNIFSVVGDGHGKVWISNSEEGLLYSTPEGDSKRFPWAQLGHKHAALALLPDRLQGGLWLGFPDGGIAYFQDSQIRSSYDVASGLGYGSVADLEAGSDGAVWAGTEGGLSRVKDGRVTTLNSRNGLPCDAVQWVIEDNDHALWLYMPCGLVRVAPSEIDAWGRDSKRTVQTTVFDSSDGVWSRGRPGHYSRNVTKSADGKIWFSPPDGVSIIDPHRLAFNKIPPPVQIQQITADGKRYDAASGLRLPARVRDLSIDYTALSLVVPTKVHFRFKLEDQDRDWREVVNDREVQYSNLAPGNYRFRLTASNNNGVWNEEGTILDFSVAPAYYQTNWFRAFCAAVVLAFAWALYRLRIRQLQQLEQKSREAIETIPAMAFTARPDGSRTFVNRRWVEYTGLSVERAAGLGWQTTVHPDDLDRVHEKWRMSVAVGEQLEYEARFRRADGEYRWFLVRAVPVRDKRGSILRWYGVVIDIEDRKRAEQERERLRQLEADFAHINRVSMMGELAASLSHELKQPITAAKTNAQTCLRWLRRPEPNVQEATEAAMRIVQDGNRAAEIIDRLRSFYKKGVPPVHELIDVNEVLGEMLALLRSEANRYAISMRTDLAAGLPRVRADRVQLQQVLLNLMLNGIEAIKDADTAGELTMKSQLNPEEQVLISVSDTGVGLPPENADQIFNAFFTTKRQGSGMGLAISRSLVESHGGRLWATANSGRGATFHFTLPTAAQEVKVPTSGGLTIERIDDFCS